jgi:phosphoheptose isomerase
MSHAKLYLAEAAQITERIDYEMIDRIAEGLAVLRDRGGRLFLLGVGGSAANCSHAVNDFRIRQWTTSRSSPRVPMMKGGTRSSQAG